MGHRELRRVPLDFDAPLNKTWSGYVNPHPAPPKCTACDATGQNPGTRQLEETFYPHQVGGDEHRAWHDKITDREVKALVKKGRLVDWTHRIVPDQGWVRWEDGRIPTAAEVNAAQRSREFGCRHDSLNRWILVETRARRLGVWGRCEVCDGNGSVPHQDPELQRAFESWKPSQPPRGPGYQLWETTSEGSPVSPVFESAEVLARWCTTNATIFASMKTSYENWLKMFREDGVEAGSLLIAKPGYFGAAVNDSAGS